MSPQVINYQKCTAESHTGIPIPTWAEGERKHEGRVTLGGTEALSGTSYGSLLAGNAPISRVFGREGDWPRCSSSPPLRRCSDSPSLWCGVGEQESAECGAVEVWGEQLRTEIHASPRRACCFSFYVFLSFLPVQRPENFY